MLITARLVNAGLTGGMRLQVNIPSIRDRHLRLIRHAHRTIPLMEDGCSAVTLTAR
jgi:hypothetical protein